MQTSVIKIEGMSCQGCVNSVEQGLKKIDGVTSVQVDLAKGLATVAHEDNVKKEQLGQRIEELGYDVVN